MRFKFAILLTAVFASVLVTTRALSQEKGGEDETGPYDVVPGFPQAIAPKGYVYGSQAGVFAETPNRIFIASRGELLLPAIPPAGYNGSYGTIDNKQTM